MSSWESTLTFKAFCPQKADFRMPSVNLARTRPRADPARLCWVFWWVRAFSPCLCVGCFFLSGWIWFYFPVRVERSFIFLQCPLRMSPHAYHQRQGDGTLPNMLLVCGKPICLSGGLTCDLGLETCWHKCYSWLWKICLNMKVFIKTKKKTDNKWRAGFFEGSVKVTLQIRWTDTICGSSWVLMEQSDLGSGASGLPLGMWLTLSLYRHGNMAVPRASVNIWLSKREGHQLHGCEGALENLSSLSGCVYLAGWEKQIPGLCPIMLAEWKAERISFSCGVMETQLTWFFFVWKSVSTRADVSAQMFDKTYCCVRYISFRIFIWPQLLFVM